MLHNEARELALKAWDKTHDAKKIAECFSVDTSTIYRLVAQRERTGSYQTRTHLRGRKPSLTPEQQQAIISTVQERPDITVREIKEKLQLSVSDETVRRTLIKAGYTYKKKSLHAREQERLRCAGEKKMLEREYRWIQG